MLELLIRIDRDVGGAETFPSFASTTDSGRTVRALPIETLNDVLKKYGRSQ